MNEWNGIYTIFLTRGSIGMDPNIAFYDRVGKAKEKCAWVCMYALMGERDGIQEGELNATIYL
jgi:hypothetical protein